MTNKEVEKKNMFLVNEAVNIKQKSQITAKRIKETFCLQRKTKMKLFGLKLTLAMSLRCL